MPRLSLPLSLKTTGHLLLDLQQGLDRNQEAPHSQKVSVGEAAFYSPRPPSLTSVPPSRS